MQSVAQIQDLNQTVRLEDTIGYALRRAGQHHAESLISHLPAGMTAAQYAVLVKLQEVGSCSQNLLGRYVLMDAATIKGVIDRLRRRGLITSQADPRDQRRLLLFLTDAGNALAAELLLAAEEAEQSMLERLTGRERDQLISLLNKMCQ